MANYGLIEAKTGSLEVQDTFINQNKLQNGALIETSNAKFTLIFCNISQNYASSGFTILFKNAQGIISNSTFESNYALKGATISSQLSNYSIFQCSFSWNQAKSIGGVIEASQDIISIQSSIFLNNEAQNGGVFSFSSVIAQIQTVKCSNNKAAIGGILQSQNSSISINFASLENNKADEGAVFYVQLTNLTFDNVQCVNNSAKIRGGVGVIQLNSIIKMSKSKVAYCRANEGAFLYSQSSYFQIKETKIFNNSAQFGEIINLQISLKQNPSYLKHTEIFNNTCYTTTILVYQGYLNINNATFSQNKAFQTSGLIIQNSTVFINQSKFSQQSAQTGSFVLSHSFSYLDISNSQFLDGNGIEAGGAFHMTSSQLKLKSVTFENMFSHTGGVIYAQSTNCTLENVKFKTTKSKDYGSVIYMKNSNFQLQSCLLNDYVNTAIVSEESILTLNNSEMTNGYSNNAYGSALYSVNSNINITNCKCQNQTSKIGSCFSIVNSKLKQEINQISNNLFEDCNAQDHGGVGYCQNANVTFSDNKFLNNIVSGNQSIINKGGALRLACDLIEKQKCQYAIQSNYFINNTIKSPSSEGGAISFQGTLPTFIPDIKSQKICKYFRNNAAYYGNNLAGFPYTIDSKYLDEVLSHCNNSKSSRNIQSIIPGLPSYESKYFLTDFFGQVVSTDNQSTAQINSEDAILEGKIKVVAERGTFNFKGVGIKGKPGKAVHLQFETNAIDEDIYILDENITNKIQEEVIISECIQGQILINGNQCQNCLYGQYSLDVNDKFCKECQKGAKCYGSDLIVPIKGY